jgi:hypothetical protein
MINLKKLKYLILFVYLTGFISCTNDDEIIQEQIELINRSSITLNGVEYETINDINSGNENCDNLYVKASFYKKDDIDIRLEINLSKDGQLHSVNYGEYKLPIVGVTILKTFLTPNFYPLKTFSISNFNYNEDTGELSFSFNGTVYFEQDNNVMRTISGSIYNKNFRSIDCSIVKTGLEFKSLDFELHNFHSYRTKFANNTQQHRYFTNNGHIFDINVQDDFWNLPMGEIVFTQNSSQNNVRIMKQLGNVIANQGPNIAHHQWMNYNTQGKIYIENKEIINGTKKISGKIDLQMIENGNIVRTLNGIKFSTLSFLD